MKPKKSQPLLIIEERTGTAIKADGTRLVIVDAIKPILVDPNPEDVRNAKSGDLFKCALCLAYLRQSGNPDLLVMVTKSRAYCEARGRGGRKELRRYILSPAAKRTTADFDIGELSNPQAAIFAVPKGSQRLYYVRPPRPIPVTPEYPAPVPLPKLRKPNPLAYLDGWAQRVSVRGRMSFPHAVVGYAK